MTLTGDEITALRTTYGMTKAELAMFLNVQTNTVWRWESCCASKPAGATPRLLMLLHDTPQAQRKVLNLSLVLCTGGVFAAWYNVLKARYA